MKRLATTAAVAALISILSGTAGMVSGCTQNEPKGTTAVQAPTDTAPARPSPFHKEELAQLESRIIQYYTKAKGQAHFDGHIKDDLLVTRYYIHHPPTGKQGIVVVVEGIVTGLEKATTRADGIERTYYRIRPFNNTLEDKPYLDFVRQVLLNPDIDYENAPRTEGIIGKLGENALFPVGMTGIIPNFKPFPLQKPFTVAHNASQLPPLDIYQAIDIRTGRQLYTFKQNISLVGPGVDFAPFGTAEGKPVLILPVAGNAVVEQILLDMRAPENSELFERLKSQPEGDGRIF